MSIIGQKSGRERPVQNSAPLDALLLESRHWKATIQVLIGRPDLSTINIKSNVRAISTIKTSKQLLTDKQRLEPDTHIS